MSLPKIGLFAVRRKKPVADSARSREQFRAVLMRERAAADRNEHEFSLLVFDNATPDLVDVLARRIRQVDEIGWFREGHLAVVLPYTPADGARTLARDISQSMAPLRPNCTIYTYPGQWVAEENDGSRSSMNTSASERNRTGKSNGASRAGEGSIRCADRPDGLFAGQIPIWKRSIDIVCSLIGLLCLSPLFLLAACAIKAVSPGPAFLRQERIVYRGKTFRIWKFRTMRVGAGTAMHQVDLSDLISQDRPMTKLDDSRDSRIFPLGRIIRRCYLDELPQLINVLRGEMSLIGPRPCIPYEAEQYKAWQIERFAAVPGMTGLWQVSGKNKTTFKEMIRLDIAYARRCSFRLDVTILLKTVPVIMEECIGRKRRSARAEKHHAISEGLAEATQLSTSLQKTGRPGNS